MTPILSSVVGVINRTKTVISPLISLVKALAIQGIFDAEGKVGDSSVCRQLGIKFHLDYLNKYLIYKSLINRVGQLGKIFY